MFANIPPATRGIIFANFALFALELTVVGPFSPEGPLALWPIGPRFQFWQLVTYAFLHGGFAHIFFNMFALWMFGAQLERFWGSRRFLSFYFASVLSAAVAQVLVTSWSGLQEATVGASGGIFGLLLGFAMFFPRQRVMLLFPPIPMPAWLFVTLYGGIELFLGVTGKEASVAHFAHLGGMLGGWLTILSWRRGAARR